MLLYYCTTVLHFTAGGKNMLRHIGYFRLRRQVAYRAKSVIYRKRTEQIRRREPLQLSLLRKTAHLPMLKIPTRVLVTCCHGCIFVAGVSERTGLDVQLGSSCFDLMLMYNPRRHVTKVCSTAVQYVVQSNTTLQGDKSADELQLHSSTPA